MSRYAIIQVVGHEQTLQLTMPQHPPKTNRYPKSLMKTFLVITKALHSPMVIGHPLFWLLRAEMHNADVCDKY